MLSREVQISSCLLLFSTTPLDLHHSHPDAIRACHALSIAYATRSHTASSVTTSHHPSSRTHEHTIDPSAYAICQSRRQLWLKCYFGAYSTTTSCRLLPKIMMPPARQAVRNRGVPRSAEIPSNPEVVSTSLEAGSGYMHHGESQLLLPQGSNRLDDMSI